METQKGFKVSKNIMLRNCVLRFLSSLDSDTQFSIQLISFVITNSNHESTRITSGFL